MHKITKKKKDTTYVFSYAFPMIFLHGQGSPKVCGKASTELEDPWIYRKAHAESKGPWKVEYHNFQLFSIGAL